MTEIFAYANGYSYYGIDIYYIILVLPALLLSLWAQIRVKTVFNRYSAVPTSRGMNGAQAAQEVLRRNGVMGVRVERVSGNLTDHYDPSSNCIRLSENVFDTASVAAVGVAAHEAGHAVQYSEEYGPVRLRMAIIKVCQVGSTLSWPLLIAGLIFSFEPLIFAGIICFSATVFFQLITLPVEFNASKRAIEGLRQSGLLDDSELAGSKKVLSAAAMTYLAALLMGLAQLFRLLMIFGGRRK